MQPIEIAAILMLVFLFMKLPVFVAVLGGSAVYFLLSPDITSYIFAQRVISGCQSIPLLAVPFFVMAGILMNGTGVTKRIMNFCQVVTGNQAGGLAKVNILLSTLMGGLSGSNLADAAMEAKLLVPSMIEKGFSNEFSSVVTAASAMITPLIPPGIGMIIYGSVTNVSIGKLFIAGIGPGMLLCISMLLLVDFISKRRGYVPIKRERITKDEYLEATRKAFFPLCLPIIIIGGIRIGIFTPTEAGAVAIIYAFILGLLYREIRKDSMMETVKETICITASVMLIVAAASCFSWILTKERIPQTITALIVDHISNKYVFLLVTNMFLLLVGMFIEGNASMIVLAPLLAPIARAYGIDDIQFAMIFIFNSSIGCLTPPMGALMFVTCGVTHCELDKFMKELVPFLGLLFVNLMLITYVPFFSTGVVNLFY